MQFDRSTRCRVPVTARVERREPNARRVGAGMVSVGCVPGLQSAMRSFTACRWPLPGTGTSEVKDSGRQA